ncbi:MAG TPA: site-specific integrase [Candidatus Saccharimonadales bacterium]|jgi:integrase/recombinase XerD|nr:site-specific integrase [Candidatus Saccharimonadales bacterium]
MRKRTGYGQTNRVNILKKASVEGKWRLFPAVVEPNGKLKDKIKVKGKIEVHPEGTYYIEWWQQGQRRREAIRDKAQVVDSARRKAIALEAAKAGIQVASEGQNQGRNLKTVLAVAIEGFLKDVEPPQREPKTYAAYKYCLKLFLENCSKSHVQDIERQDLLRFIRKQYELGCGARTAYNRANIVAQFLKLNGVTGLLHKRDWPEYVDAIRRIYEADELNSLFAACKASEKVRYLFFLLTGERDKEVRYTAWRDIDFRRGTVRVTAKPQLAFKPKNKEEREIPVPASLLEALKAHKAQQTGPNPYNLVFPTEAGHPDKNFESKLKKIANRAGLNCGTCASRHGNRCTEGAFCGNWFLHKFRHTFATVNLEGNVCSIRKLQEWLGHKDLASTMVYLKYVRGKDVHERLNNSELAGFAISAVGGKSALKPQVAHAG